MLRKYAYLVALAREKHFGRAAAACHVSQPTLSNAMRQLEAALGVPIVERGPAFRGFTPDGETVLTHARRMLAEQEALTQTLRDRSGGLSGTARLGVIPTALPAVPDVLAPFAARHPAVRFVVHSMSSREIERGLNTYDLDAGLTYLDNEPLPDVRRATLYVETPLFLCRRDTAVLPDGPGRITWADAAAHPLCLLTPDMQNRRITEAAFRTAGVTVAPAVETNSLINLYALVRHGPWASIAPSRLPEAMRDDPALLAVPLVEPDVRHAVGLVYADRDPPASLVQALAATVSSVVGPAGARGLSRA
ncbi:LysR family transcriptional regulator [Roseospira marina]|uniref:LysR family transcriptional regulator n=1 Tax=Roseospira marina TaxID=140057 RepID=A0A5M6IIE0_9PROT|nr:LysR family transcriptional regulator [Roseospira marina]KAA5607629.1 LysR family transcriptional regulator [Roseospira marina]MBB4312171.1 DNA-binding transcriptional LysR family regulator [Roseospira marina]MBB5085813.1 DNA-binding transcriptional LysR family regulator [Roseospira marina]